jgi:hypothetical protein
VWFLGSVPNYPQTYLFGLALFLIYRKILLKILAGSRAFVPEAVGFGLLAGFAFYLYGQVVYFFFAMALHASFFYLRDRYRVERNLLKVLLPTTKGLRGGLLAVAAVLLVLPFLTEKPIAVGSHNKLDFMICCFTGESALCRYSMAFKSCGTIADSLPGLAKLLAWSLRFLSSGTFPRFITTPFLGCIPIRGLV